MMVLASVYAFGQNGKKFFKAGTDFLDGKKYEDAIAQFTSAIGAEPSNAEYYISRASTYELLLKYNEAYTDYEKARVFDEKNVNIIIRLGAVCNYLGKYDEALKLLNRASAMDKRNGLIYPEKITTLFGLGKYDQALKVSDTAMLFKETAKIFYDRGQIYVKLHNDILAKKEFDKSLSKDKNYAVSRLAMAELLLRAGDQGGALGQCNLVLQMDDRNTDAYLVRSKIYVANLDYPKAIDDISKNILIAPNKPEFYYTRGLYYQQFNQHSNAINDFSKLISLSPDSANAYFARAKSYEEIMSFDKAAADYQKITVLSEFDMRAQKLLKDAQTRLFELNREAVPPEIIVSNPAPIGDTVEMRGDNRSIQISGKIKDKSIVESITINDEKIPLVAKNGEYEFLANIEVEGLNKLVIVAKDEYSNVKTLNYNLKRTEIEPPKVFIMAPYASSDGLIFLETNSPTVFVEGKISDMSKIKSIFIEGVTASYPVNDLNPSFTANIDVANKTKIVVVAEDIYGNRQESEFKLNRDVAVLNESNPMGKTWVVFINNSNYQTFASLAGPVKDVNLMTRALGNYQISNIITKEDMTKAEMEKFFSIELRDLVKTNQVKSLLVWYAGHGKFINDVGYWIPVDAQRDDEFTYFNIGGLRASMETYMNYLTHALVVTDACESGPSFYQAMRADMKSRDCSDWQSTQFKSSQVFSSAGYELAVDDSQFTRTFANALSNNPDACIPIEEIVTAVSKAVGGNNQQQPKFGKITGLKDEDGTFFFMAK